MQSSHSKVYALFLLVPTIFESLQITTQSISVSTIESARALHTDIGAMQACLFAGGTRHKTDALRLGCHACSLWTRRAAQAMIALQHLVNCTNAAPRDAQQITRDFAHADAALTSLAAITCPFRPVRTCAIEPMRLLFGGVRRDQAEM